MGIHQPRNYCITFCIQHSVKSFDAAVSLENLGDFPIFKDKIALRMDLVLGSIKISGITDQCFHNGLLFRL